MMTQEAQSCISMSYTQISHDAIGTDMIEDAEIGALEEQYLDQ